MGQLLLSLLLLVSFITHVQPTTWNYVFPLSDLNGVMDVATGPAGNICVTGRFTGSLQLGGTLLTSTRPGPCLYIAKFSPGGQVLRLTQREGATDVLPRSIAVDQTGNTYVTGSFPGTLSYDNGQQTTSLLATPANGTIFLLKWAPTGSVSWVRQPMAAPAARTATAKARPWAGPATATSATKPAAATSGLPRWRWGRTFATAFWPATTGGTNCAGRGCSPTWARLSALVV